MQAKVEMKCGRCGKTEEVLMNVEDLLKHTADEKEKSTAFDAFKSTVAALPNTDNLPDVIVMLKNPAGNYEVQGVSNLCHNDSPDAKRRGCRARVADILADLFATDKTPRQPRKKKDPKEEMAKEIENIAAEV